MKNKIFDDLVTPQEAAEILGLAERTIRQAIETGKLIDGVDCKKYNRQWLIYKPSLSKMENIKSRKNKE